jgi:predicted anti-sigma-YlaC factor YlaD
VTSTCGEVRLALGAYVLGSLEPTERVVVDDHLDGCANCRDEVAEFAGLPGLLARVDATDALTLGEPLPVPPAELLDRLLDAAAEHRRRVRRVRLVGAAAAAVLIAGGAVVAGAMVANGSNHHLHTVTASRNGVSAIVTESPKGWGTSLGVQVKGVAEGETCSLVVVSKSGVKDVAASWEIGYSGSVKVTGSTALAEKDIARYDVVTSDGTRLLSVPA